MGLKRVILGIGLLGLSVGLSGCIGQLQAATLAPEEVLKNFSVSLAGLTSFQFDLALRLSGNLPNGLGGEMTDATLEFTGRVDGANVENPALNATGSIVTAVDGVPVSLRGSVINLADYTYFRINDIQLPLLLPLGDQQLNQWYKVKHPSATSGLRLGGAESVVIDEADLQSVNQSLQDANLVELVEVLPDETIGSTRSYHFKARFSPSSLSTLLNQVDQILHTNIHQTEFNGLDQYIFDVWVSKRDFYPTRLALRDVYQLGSSPIGVDMDITFARHNEIVPIQPPQETTDNYGRVFEDAPAGF